MPTATPISELDLVLVSTRKCGFCGTGTHDRCPGGTRSGRKGVRICPCEVGERCGQKRCLKCNNRHADDVGDDWTCIDQAGCEARVQSRLDADPQHQNLVKIRRKAMATTTEETKAKREKVVKVGKCLVTGKETKGGLFAPGQDAKYVSLRVAEVEEAKFTKTAEAKALKQMKDDGTSEKLQAKFTKAVGLAKARAEKAAELAKQKADAKKTAASKKKDSDDED